MVKYICFIRLTREFLKQTLEERKRWILTGVELSKKYGLNILFWGSTLGVKKHAVMVFEAKDTSNGYIKFQREWQGLGTEEAGKFIEHTRTITVF